MNKTAPKLDLYMACDIRKGCRFLGHSFMAISGQYLVNDGLFSAFHKIICNKIFQTRMDIAI